MITISTFENISYILMLFSTKLYWDVKTVFSLVLLRKIFLSDICIVDNTLIEFIFSWIIKNEIQSQTESKKQLWKLMTNGPYQSRHKTMRIKCFRDLNCIECLNVRDKRVSAFPYIFDFIPLKMLTACCQSRGFYEYLETELKK